MTKNTSLFDAYKSDVTAQIAGVSNAFTELKEASIAKAADAGFPTGRDEDWRYSNLKALRGEHYAMAAEEIAVKPSAITEDVVASLVFVNGHFSEDLSDTTDLTQVASLSHLSNYLAADIDVRTSDLIKGSDTISLMNTALTKTGMIIKIPAGVELDGHIEIHHIGKNADQKHLMTRIMIEMGEGSSASIIERFSGDDSAYWTNSMMQVRACEKSSLKHYKLQEEGLNATHTSSVHVQADAEAKYQGFNLQTGANYGRVEHHVAVLGEEADIRIDGANLAGTGQTLDTRTVVDHKVPNAVSDQIFRAVLNKKGSSAFQGKVIVAIDAQKTLADQSCRALLLDRTAEANAKPELEICADDVKCSHGATVGELDEKAYFYLVSRGIDPESARQILVEAFAADALEFVADTEIQTLINDRILNWMATSRVEG